MTVTQRFLYLLLCHVSSSGWSSVAPLVISGVGDSGTRAARKISTSIFKLSFYIHWGFKNPRALYFYPLLHLIFPAIKLVLVIRDGRDIATGDNQYSFSSIGSFILNQEYLDDSSWAKQVKSRPM